MNGQRLNIYPGREKNFDKELKLLEEESNKPIKCICGALNNPQERYCFKCFKSLNVETVIQDQEIVNSEINKAVKFMMEMAKSPEMMQKFAEFRKAYSNKK